MRPKALLLLPAFVSLSAGSVELELPIAMSDVGKSAVIEGTVSPCHGFAGVPERPLALLSSLG